MASPSKFNVVLFEPVIPQNTGSIARLCACTGASLHLIRPLGFDIDDAAVKRAGLDYWAHVDIHDYENWNEFVEIERPKNLYFMSKKAETSYASIKYETPCFLVLGSETNGLPSFLWERYLNHFFQVPMRTHLVRSLNLSQCAAVVLYEAMRQHAFTDLF